MPSSEYENIPGSSASQKRAAAMAARAEGRPLTGPTSARQRLAAGKLGAKDKVEKTAEATARRNAEKAAVAKRARERQATAASAANQAQNKALLKGLNDAIAGRRPTGLDTVGRDVEEKMRDSSAQASANLERERKRRGS